MGVQLNPDSEQAKELERWNRRKDLPSPYGRPGERLMDGMNAAGYEPYPRMLYQARVNPRTQQMRCLDVIPDPRYYTDPALYTRDVSLAEDFNKACTRIVHSQSEERRAWDEGWRESPPAAEAYAEALAQAIAQAAAERHHADQRLSAQAQAEAARVDEAAGVRHVPDPPAPKKRGGWRPRKPKPAAVGP